MRCLVCICLRMVRVERCGELLIILRYYRRSIDSNHRLTCSVWSRFVLLLFLLLSSQDTDTAAAGTYTQALGEGRTVIGVFCVQITLRCLLLLLVIVCTIVVMVKKNSQCLH